MQAGAIPPFLCLFSVDAQASVLRSLLRHKKAGLLARLV